MKLIIKDNLAEDNKDLLKVINVFLSKTIKLDLDNSQESSNFENYINNLHDLLKNYNDSGCADSKYISEIRTGDDKKIQSSIWEAQLWTFLTKHHFTLSSNDKGPDFLFEHQGQKIWIEAIAPSFPETKEDDSFESGIIKTDQYALAWTKALKAKKEIFKKYIDNGIVSDQDVCIIAISPLKGDSSSFRAIPCEIPYFLQVTLGISDLHMKNNSSVYLSRSNIITSKNKSPCSANVFSLKDYEHISAVLCTNAHSVFLENEYWLVHNSNAKVPLNKKALCVTEEISL